MAECELCKATRERLKQLMAKFPKTIDTLHKLEQSERKMEPLQEEWVGGKIDDNS